jgi:hypothetical protein
LREMRPEPAVEAHAILVARDGLEAYSAHGETPIRITSRANQSANRPPATETST